MVQGELDLRAVLDYYQNMPYQYFSRLNSIY
jgi:hypothetical protein